MKPGDGRKALGSLLDSAANMVLAFVGVAFLLGLVIGGAIMLALR